MAIFELKKDDIVEVSETTFSDQTIREREDLQRVLRDRVEIMFLETMVLVDEFSSQ